MVGCSQMSQEEEAAALGVKRKWSLEYLVGRKRAKKSPP